MTSLRHLLTALALASLTACDGTPAASGDASSDPVALDDRTPAIDTGADALLGDVSAPPRDAIAPPRDVSAPDAPANDVPVGPRAAHYAPDTAPWYTDISAAPVDSESPMVIPWLDGQGWGLGRFQIDFSIEVLEADGAAPLRAFTRTGDFYTPDCDFVTVPVPAMGALEGESGYACTMNGDCHLLVAHRPTNRLYEMWRANITSSGFMGGCLAVWDMSRVYSPSGRGENCSSADAAGLPISPLLFTADEVAAGNVDHAIRFILPNARIRSRTYVHPATHATGAATGPGTAPPYGARLRLRADFPMASLPNEGARAVARGLQRYGMFLADGGNVALTGRTDRSTRAHWAGLLGSRDMQNIRPRDFEMVAGGMRYRFTGDCVRTP